MRLQTKIGLAMLPMIVVPIILIGTWSVSFVADTIEKNMSGLMVQGLDDFIEDRVNNYYTILKTNRLDSIESFVNNYQQKLYSETKEVRLLETGKLIILDKSGNILNKDVDPVLKPETLIEISEQVAERHPQWQAGYLEKESEHRLYVGGFFEPWGWVLVYTVSQDIVHASQVNLRNKALVVALVCILIGFGLMVVIFRIFFVKPVTLLQKTAQDIAALKHVENINIHSNDELGELARSMQSMASSIKEYQIKQESWQRHLEEEVEKNVQDLSRVNIELTKEVDTRMLAEQKLKKSEEQFKAIFESSTDSIVVWSRTHECLYVNQATLDHIERPREKILGKNIKEGLAHIPEAREKWAQRIDRVFFTGRPERVEDKITINERQIYSESVASPIKDADGEMFAVGVVYRDVSKRRSMEQQIFEALNLNQKIISVSTLGISVYDSKGDAILTNDAACEIIGAPKEQVLKQNFNMVESWEKTGLTAAANNVLETGIEQQKEVRTRSLFGKEVWLECRLSRFSLTGEFHLLVVFDNVIERKKLENQIKSSLQEKEVLLKEIYHRVKNNMQVVSSILKMQSRYVEDHKSLEIFKESQDRITSMALVHEQLYQAGNLTSIDFGTYLRELVHSLEFSFGIDHNKIHLNIDAKDLKLGVDTAIPCGLVINELLSNIFKYAFPQGEKGEIALSFHVGENSVAKLCVKDNGVGIPQNIDIEKSKTLGLKLVYNLVTHQLDGDVRLEHGNGTKFIIEFPYSDISEKKRVEA